MDELALPSYIERNRILFLREKTVHSIISSLGVCGTSQCRVQDCTSARDAKQRGKGSAGAGVQLTGRELVCPAHRNSMFDAPIYFSLSGDT